MYNWELLNEPDNPVLEGLRKKWINILGDSTQKEAAYHDFLAKHPAFFFNDTIRHSPLVISKVQLGSEFATDFVVPLDQASLGLTYELIEIESPHTPPYTKKGVPSARLNTAIQQILNWQRWISQRPAIMKDLLPGACSDEEPAFIHTVIIGNRENSKQWRDRRNQLSRQINIRIRSFDSFTDRLSKRFFMNCGSRYQSEFDHLHLKLRNELENPFYIALSHAEWREFVRAVSLSCHGIAKSAELIVRTRKIGSLFEDFKRMQDNQQDSP